MNLQDLANDWNQTFLRMEGYDDCIVGVVERYGQEPILCYNKKKVINKLIAQGLSADEAIEYFLFNQLGAWIGEDTPCFISLQRVKPE